MFLYRNHISPSRKRRESEKRPCSTISQKDRMQVQSSNPLPISSVAKADCLLNRMLGRAVMKLGFLARLSPIVLLLLTASCATVEIHRIGTDGEVIGPEGLRFYMPRPYVAVNEPFIVSGEAYLVGGEITPDGKYVLINDIKLTDGTNGRFVSRFLGTTARKISVTNVIAVDEGMKVERSGEQSTSEGAMVKEEETETASLKKPVQEKTGTLNLKVANDNSAYAVTPMKRYIDIVWLPDFEEQYVVKGKAGLGNASIAMQLGQGWSLQGIEANVDNSSMTGRIYDLIDQGAEILSTLGRAQLGLPPVSMGGGEQFASETPPDVTRFLGGTPLTVKVTFVRIAAPGIYPILKPEEMEKIPSDQKAFEDRILVPIAPMTNIAFNTYEAVVVEAALATGDSALRLHQYIDLRPGGGATEMGSGRGASGSTMTTDPDWKAVAEMIGNAAPQYMIVDVSSDIDLDAKVIVKVKKDDGSTITSDTDKNTARSTIGPVINPALKAKAPGYEDRPIDYVFP